MSLRLLLASGWLLQVVGFTAALLRQGRRAAEPKEWPREILLRVVMAVLIAVALLAPTASTRPLPRTVAVPLAAAFWAGQILATWARATLGGSWRLGVAPGGPRVRRGAYRLLRHPIYLGNLSALVSQAVFLQNKPALVLAAGGVVVVAIKVAAEARALRPRPR